MGENSYVIGVCGHRHLPHEGIAAITAKIQAFYQAEVTRSGAERITIMSSLAVGSDTLCAKLALDSGLRLIVPLPMKALEYRNDFPEPLASEYDCLLSIADQVFVVDAQEPVPPNPQRGFYYRQAGIYVVKHCDVLLAVWDGNERDSADGAGTWETVKLARGYGKEIKHIEALLQQQEK